MVVVVVQLLVVAVVVQLHQILTRPSVPVPSQLTHNSAVLQVFLASDCCLCFILVENIYYRFKKVWVGSIFHPDLRPEQVGESKR